MIDALITVDHINYGPLVKHNGDLDIYLYGNQGLCQNHMLLWLDNTE
jgi:hypothetical protein